MQIDVRDSSGVTIMNVEGRVDSATAPSLDEELEGALDADNNRVVINLEAVEYISSAGLRVLVRAMQRAQSMGGDLRLAAPQESVRAVLELTGMDSLFEIHATRSDAVASF